MSRCALCPARHTCVEPTGPECSDYTFLGEAPGVKEDKKGIPFVGPTGQEFREHYLAVAGLKANDIHIRNAIYCLPDTPGHKLDSNNTAHLKLLESCTNHHLYPYLKRVKPKTIIPMGAFACRALDPEINLDLHHGIPLETKWGTVFPMWHPAGGIHEPKKMLHIRTDWIRFRKFITDRLEVYQDEYSSPDYSEVTSVREIQDIDPTIPLANDTEWSRSEGVYCYTYSQYPGTGRLIRIGRTDLFAALQRKFDRWESELWWHNWLYDNSNTDSLGLRLPHLAIRDTMIRAFHLGNIPQGLKALAFRELGMKMQDFDDLVTPYSQPHVLDYFRLAYLQNWEKPEAQMKVQDDGSTKLYQPQSMKTKLKRFFTDLSKKPDKDVFKSWDNWEESQAQIEEVCGSFPGKDIAHVPFDEMLYYACRDADALIRLGPVIEVMKSNVLKTSQEHWRDYGRFATA